MFRILSIAGTRPNFIKLAALQRAFAAHPRTLARLVHTGQHYDDQMSRVFFEQLELPRPDLNLGIGSGTHAEQFARIMMALEPVLADDAPDAVLVVGDVNSTAAAALTATKLHLPVVHVEAGLRSFDRRMPEEINRIVTDALADVLYVTEASGLAHLRREGIPDEKVCFAGNVMIDSLIRYREKAARLRFAESLGLAGTPFVLMTLHRPATVDHPARLREAVELIRRVAARAPVVFPLHPRTRHRLADAGLLDALHALDGLHLTEPLGYLEFLHLMMHATLVLTDSGGIQEETTFLRVPCLTLRDTTERPVTTTLGTNVLLPLDVEPVMARVEEALGGAWTPGEIPPLWDGHAAERIVDHLVGWLSARKAQPLASAAKP